MNAARSSHGPGVFAHQVARPRLILRRKGYGLSHAPRSALSPLCPRASGDFGLVDGAWDGDAFEHFPDVMPYTVPSMAWSAKRKRMRTKESQVWQEEMDHLKSKWAKTNSFSSKQVQQEENDTTFDDWHWCAHADAVRCWEKQKSTWSQDRARAFQVAQERLNNFNAQQSQHQSRFYASRQPMQLNDPLGFYAALGIQSSATLPEIKSAFREACFENHPDVNGASDTSDERMKTLLHAYQILKDDTKRRLYDTQGIC